MRPPRDLTPYRQHSQSRPISRDIEDGSYVYVVDELEVVWVLKDGPHRHPRVLGGARPASYAGDLRNEDGVVVELTNLSGTFLFGEIDGLLSVAHLLRQIGFEIGCSAVRYFPIDGRRPQTLE